MSPSPNSRRPRNGPVSGSDTVDPVKKQHPKDITVHEIAIFEQGIDSKGNSLIVRNDEVKTKYCVTIGDHDLFHTMTLCDIVIGVVASTIDMHYSMLSAIYMSKPSSLKRANKSSMSEEFKSETSRPYLALEYLSGNAKSVPTICSKTVLDFVDKISTTSPDPIDKSSLARALTCAIENLYASEEIIVAINFKAGWPQNSEILWVLRRLMDGIEKVAEDYPGATTFSVYFDVVTKDKDALADFMKRLSKWTLQTGIDTMPTTMLISGHPEVKYMRLESRLIVGSVISSEDSGNNI
ncbi:unnamed protein product [Alternaria alternata]